MSDKREPPAEVWLTSNRRGVASELFVMPLEDDGYPEDWNRVYQRGRLVRASPPVECGGIKISACRFYDCSGVEVFGV